MTRKKPASEHALTGTYRADRHRPREALAGAMGAAPEHLDEGLRLLWAEVAAQIPVGVAACDRFAFELLVRSIASMRAGAMTPAGAAQLRQMIGDFGLSPGARQRMEIASPPEGSEPAGFAF